MRGLKEPQWKPDRNELRGCSEAPAIRCNKAILHNITPLKMFFFLSLDSEIVGKSTERHIVLTDLYVKYISLTPETLEHIY